MAIRGANFKAIGTAWHLQVEDVPDERTWEELLQQIHLRIEAFDKTYSRFRTDSLVTRMSRESGHYPLPSDASPLLGFYRKLYQATDGHMTPLIGQVMVDAGYDADYSLQPKALQKPAAWEKVITYTPETITLSQLVLLDFGAAGKGYLVDIIGELLQKAGITSFTINAGGDILHRSASKQALTIGMENPLDTSEAIGVVELTDGSLCASSGSKRKWGKYHHIIDPIRLESPQEVLATWVIASGTMTADGIATALFFTDPQTLLKHFEFTYALLYPDMSLQHTHDFPVKPFKAE